MRNIHFATHHEGAATSWLLNCFLELGIRLGGYDGTRVVDQYHLVREPDIYALPEEDRKNQSRFIPSLMFKSEFQFIDGFRVIHTHEFPEKRYIAPQDSVFMLVREPRDGFVSRYLRERLHFHNPTIEAYLSMFDERTCLDRIDTWCLFFEAWAALAEGKVYLFEDYKKSPEGTLRRILNDLGIPFTEERLRRALEASTLEKCREAESLWLSKNQSPVPRVHTDGMVGKHAAVISSELGDRIIDRCSGVCSKYWDGYADKTPHSYYPNLLLLMDRYIISNELHQRMNDEDYLHNMQIFLNALTEVTSGNLTRGAENYVAIIKGYERLEALGAFPSPNQ